MSASVELRNVVIPLTHHKNIGYTELKFLGVYLSPACGGGKDMGRSIILLFTAFLVGVLKGYVVYYTFIITIPKTIVNHLRGKKTHLPPKEQVCFPQLIS
jgi:hypothetical protein